MKKTFTTVAISLALALLAACNTVQGVGRDIESVGRSGEEAIN